MCLTEHKTACSQISNSSPPQFKAATEAVVDPAHSATETEETDFFSIYFYDTHERKHRDQTHRLKQKVSGKPSVYTMLLHASKQPLRCSWSLGDS